MKNKEEINKARTSISTSSTSSTSTSSSSTSRNTLLTSPPRETSPEKKYTRSRARAEANKSKEEYIFEEAQEKRRRSQIEEPTKKKFKEIEEAHTSAREARLKRREERKAKVEMEDKNQMDAMDEDFNEEEESYDDRPDLLRTILKQMRGGMAQMGRMQPILEGLRSGEETQQMVCLQDLCELLSMGTEETLAGFSVEEFVPALMEMMNIEHNPEIMLIACRCLSNMIEALPGSSMAIAALGGVPVICAKLLNIEYIDLAEQALVTLEKMSAENPAVVVKAGGLTAVLSYLDFFPLGVQRSAVSTASNLCKNYPISCFDLLGDSTTILVNLLKYHDTKIVERACLALSRLVDSFSNYPDKLQIISSGDLVKNMVNMISPPNNTSNSGTFIMIIRLLGTLSKNCPIIAVELVEKTNILSIISDNLGNPTPTATKPSTKESPISSPFSPSKSNDQTYEILNLIFEIMPPIPKSEVFIEIEFDTRGNKYMRRREEDIFKIKSKVEEKEKEKEKGVQENPDPRLNMVMSNDKLMVTLGQSFIQTLIDCYSSTIGSNIRVKSVMTICKILYFSNQKTLEEVLKDITISSFVAGLLANKDQGIVVTAVQMCHILLQKLSKIFTTYFKREGVVFELTNLTKITEVAHNTNPSPPVTPSQTIPLPSSSQDSTLGRLSGLLKKARERREESQEYRLPIQKNIPKTDYTSWIVKYSTQLLDNYFEKAHLGSDQLDSLTSHSISLQNSKKEGWEELLTNISKFFTDSGVSSFELHQSGLIEILQDFLTKEKDREERIQLFIKTWMTNRSGSNPFLTLVRKTQECLTKYEGYAISIHEIAGSDSKNPFSALKIIKQAFKISLQKMENSDPIKDMSDSLISIEPLATIQSIESFLKQRAVNKTEELKKMLQQRARNDSEVEDISVEKSESQQLQQSSSSTQTAEEPIIEILIGDKVLPRNMTILQAIEKFYSKSVDPSSSGIQHTFSFSTLYTFKYRLVKTRSQVPDSDLVSTSSMQLPPLQKEEQVFGMSDLFYNLESIKREKDGNEKNFEKEKEKEKEKDEKEKEKENNDRVVEMCLNLLKVLNSINSHWRDAFKNDQSLINPSVIGAVEFVNAKISAKLTRQLQDPLSICRPNLPDWCEYLTQSVSFLFPFECRYTYLYSTSFGMSRALLKLQERANEGHNDSQEPRIGRTQRQKVRIMRSKIFESAIKIMEMYASAKSIIEIEYFDEVGTGLGPTLEFYTLASKEFRKKSLNLWRTQQTQDEYAFMPCGLFPRPISEKELNLDSGKMAIKLFKSLGTFVAKALLDFRTLDLPLSHFFFKCAMGQYSKMSIRDILEIDPSLFKSLSSFDSIVRQKRDILNSTSHEEEKKEKIQNLKLNGTAISELCLDFTLPGYPDIELKANGANINVTIDNLDEYLELCLRSTLQTSVAKQMEAFSSGFNLVFPLLRLKIFLPSEIDAMINGTEEIWDRETILDSIKCDHGYTAQSGAIGKLVSIMSEFDASEQRQFLTFITGSPRLPVGGLKSLSPQFTVVKRSPEGGLTPDHYLPSAMTCANYLKLPDYSSKEIMKSKLTTAMTEGQGSFHLS